ncbi:MAG TPA: hypothetical protein VH661_04980 [Candidatus Dormibacteraeota bacterium]|jgi:hypothetical protein|nr:hypothetical protein [Candidatus Dormibacteraeota bacterium]
MSESVATQSGAGAQPRVPGTVQLMTSEPISMPASAADGQSSLREQLEERPWLLAVGFLALVGFFLLLRARRPD